MIVQMPVALVDAQENAPEKESPDRFTAGLLF
jgi:hypothetical protein